MRIMHVALGGCLSAGPVKFGITEDTGGHIAFILGATAALAARDDISAVDIVTRAFVAPDLGAEFSQLVTDIDAKRRILRLRTGSSDYLEKADLLTELPALEGAFLRLLSQSPLPDVIHAHFSDAAVLARAAKRRFDIPWVFSAHSLGLQKGTTDPSHENRIERERAAIEDADAIVASSRDEAERQISAYALAASGRTYRTEPGVQLQPDTGTGRAERLIAPWLRSPQKPIVLAIARPVHKKNLGALIDAYASSAPLRERANLVIAAGQRRGIGRSGCETDRVVSDLFNRVDGYDLWGHVALPRKHTAEDVRSLYALAADGGVFVNPALFEPFGLTIVEAAQAGVPVVATRHGGPANILDRLGYGKLIEPDEPSEIASACLSILSDPDRPSEARCAQDNAIGHYSWDAWATKVAAIYAGLGKTQSPNPRPRRLLISDMDGTLTGDRLAVARLVSRLRQTPELSLVIATGRPITETRRVISTWGLPEPECLITSVGSEVWWRSRGGAYALDAAYADRITDGWDADVVLSLGRATGLTAQSDYEQRPSKRSFEGDALDAAKLTRALSDAGLPARIIPSHGRFIDVLPATAGKAAAAEHVARRYGLTRDDCLAAGDSGNDRDLLTWAARAVIPSNGMREIADLIGPDIHRAKTTHAAGVLDALDLWDSGRATPAAIAAE